MSTSFNSPARSPASSRFQLALAGGGLGNVSRMRSSSHKRLPEPLRRAVADCLSTSSSLLHGGPSSEASRILRDYLTANSTVDLAYNVLLEHTLAERERSPAVVARCVSLLKRHLLRYQPNEETLLQIDRFCASIITECALSQNRKLVPRSHLLSQQSGVFSTSPNVSPLLVSNSSRGLLKSINYVRSLVSQYIPRRSFQPAAFAGAPSASRQSLPTLSSLLSRSFNSHISPLGVKETPEIKEASALSVKESSIPEEDDFIEDSEFIPPDIFKWRWCRDQHASLISTESDHVLKQQDLSMHSFLEVGAAGLLIGDLEAKMKGKPWKTFGNADMPYLDQLLQPSLLTTVTSSASARAHLRAITALKRSKPGPQQIWEDSPMITFRPRARPLFQYRHYSEQQPLRLNPAEVSEVIAAVCSEAPAPNANFMTVSSKLSNNSGKPSMDVAVSVLVKLLIDMYVMDSETAGPLTLFMLEEMLNSPRLVSKARAFDLILNLGVHAHLLEPPAQDDASTVDEAYSHSQEPALDNEVPISLQGKGKDYLQNIGNSLAIDKFECWILGILAEVLLHLVQVEEMEESIWASALGCLLYFLCDRGKIRRSRLTGLDIRVIKLLIVISRKHSWAETVHCNLICMLTNMFYEVPDMTNKAISTPPMFLPEQVDLIGGIQFIFHELVLSTSREERRNLFLVLFDYVLHQINEACIAAGVSEYSDQEVRPIAIYLVLANASEALHISVKLGVEGIIQLLRRSVSSALSRYANSDRLIMLMDKIVEKFDAHIRSFTHLDQEFSTMTMITKASNSIESIDLHLGNSAIIKSKLSWATLHSLLHSERHSYRHHGYLWLGDLLMEEINEKGGSNVLSNIKDLQQKIALAGVKEYSAALDVPLHIWLMCGLLKSKNNFVRWGFLYIIERLLMRCKFLLDESEAYHAVSGDTLGQLRDQRCLQKANVVIDIMSCALSLMALINETDPVNILKMCDILFSQLCLKVLPANATPLDVTQGDKDYNTVGWNKKADIGDHPSKKENTLEESTGDPSGKLDKGPLTGETASMATLLLSGQAIVPMQLVSRVPVVLFYWPLIQLAGAATDNIALGVSVGSKGRGNVPGATSDIRATLLLLLIGKCTADPAAFKEVDGEEFFRELLDDTDSRVAYHSSTFLLKRMMTEEPENYQKLLHSLVSRAQQSNNEKLLENPYLQMRGLLHLSNE